MQISERETKKILELGHNYPARDEAELSNPAIDDAELVRELTAKVIDMPDREDRIAELKAAIDSGTYNVSGHEIIEAMIRRAIADRIR